MRKIFACCSNVRSSKFEHAHSDERRSFDITFLEREKASRMRVLLLAVVFVVSANAFSPSNFAPRLNLRSACTGALRCETTTSSREVITSALPQFFSRRKDTSLRSSVAAAEPEAPKKGGFLSKFDLPSPKTLKKLLPLGSMLFFILFNYTILRDTKDVLVVTAPNSGAEIIPFLKTYVNLPSAIAFTVLYSSLCNTMSTERVFYTVTSAFLAFFGAFAGIIYPNRMLLHPHAAADWLTTILPAFFVPLIAIFRNWTYALFYTLANLWGSVVVSLLFWGFANEITSVDEAKKYYSLFGLMANVALIFSGQYVKYVSHLRSGLPAGADPWGHSLNMLMGAVVGCGAVIMGIMAWMQKEVLTDPDCIPAQKKGKKTKTKLSFGDSAKFLSNSPYIKDLATMVIGYGMAINIVEVTWKSKLKAAFPNPNEYSSFMGNFSSATGVVTLVMMIAGRFILKKFGWGVAALITPVTLLLSGAVFFSLNLFPAFFAPITAKMGTTPLMLAVFVGAAQNIISKGAKYSLFDPCKEMAYIPLDAESKTKGKAAVDVIGNPLGKSGGSFLQQILIGWKGSLSASTPFLGGLLGLIIIAWIDAARSLNKQFLKKEEEMERATWPLEDFEKKEQ